MALKINNLYFEYIKNKLFFKDLNLEVEASKITALVGANGCGKTTLLKNIANLFDIKSGEIIYDDIYLNKLQNKQRAKILSYMSQHPSVVDRISALDTILLGRKPYIKYNYTKHDYEMAKKFIDTLGLQNIVKKDFSSLSGGEKQRVLLAKALMQEPKILLLDEPNNHLDPKNQIEALQLIEFVSKQFNLITIVVLHDINLALRLAQNIIMMKDKKILDHIKKEQLTKKHLESIFSMEIEFVEYKEFKTVIFNPNNINLIEGKL